MVRRRIWCETLPHDRLRTPAVLSLLQRYGLELFLAVRPNDLHGLPATLAACSDAGVPVTLWPMISDAEGRWASLRNAVPFTAFARSVLQSAVHNGPAAGLVVDLEPSFHTMTMLFSYTPLPHGERGARSNPTTHARALFVDLVREVHDHGLVASAAVIPLALFDPRPPARALWQYAMATPVDGIPWDHVTSMLYTSILEGWSRGLMRRIDAVSLLAGGSMVVRDRCGAVGGVSLGAVGVGAPGDEPVYRSPGELAEDVAIARACGVEDLALFDLAGVLARPPVEPWLDAFTRSEALTVRPWITLRAKACLLAAATPGALARRWGI